MNTNRANIIKLRIKRKSLAAEARIIKNEETALKFRTEFLRTRQAAEEVTAPLLNLRMDLREHRKAVVSFEARASHLANAYLRGQKYNTVEKAFHSKFWRNAFYTRKKLLMRTAEIVAKYTSDESYYLSNRRENTDVVVTKLQTWIDDATVAQKQALAA